MKPSGESFLEQTQSRRLGVDVMMRTSIPLLHPQPLLPYKLDQLLELAHAN